MHPSACSLEVLPRSALWMTLDDKWRPFAFPIRIQFVTSRLSNVPGQCHKLCRDLGLGIRWSEPLQLYPVANYQECPDRRRNALKMCATCTRNSCESAAATAASNLLFIWPTGIIKASSIGRQPLVYKCKSALNFNTNSPNSEANKQIGLGEMAAQREAAAAESQEDYDYAITIRKSLPAVKFHKDQVATSCNKSKLI